MRTALVRTYRYITFSRAVTCSVTPIGIQIGYIDEVPKTSTTTKRMIPEPRLCTPKDIVVVIVIHPMARGDHWCLTREGRIVKPNIKKANFEPVVPHQINQFGGLCGYWLLVEKHKQTVKPFRGHAVRGRSQSEEDDLLLSRAATSPSMALAF